MLVINQGRPTADKRVNLRPLALNRRQWLTLTTGLAALCVRGEELDASDANTLSLDRRPAFIRLETAARGLDPKRLETFDELAAAVLDLPPSLQFGPEIPSEIRQLAGPRLARGEQAYSLHALRGIDESTLVSTLNDLSHQFKMPVFAQVTPHQIQAIRMSALRSLPAFMDRGVTEIEELSRKAQIRYLSPLQATYLSFLIANVKLWDPEFQLAPSDWEAGYQRREFFWQQDRGRSRARLFAIDGVKQAELERALAENVSPSNALAATGAVLTRWGV